MEQIRTLRPRRGLEIPTVRDGDYMALVGAVIPMGEFFDCINHGVFEITEEGEDWGRG